MTPGRALVTIVLLMVACATHAVTAGMGRSEVEEVLGPPDRKAVEMGKLLRALSPDAQVDTVKYRIVYIYDKSKVRIWFENGRAVAMTRDGIAAW